ncbi:MFS transporter [Chitinophaga oryzae]|uniref:MFS transporter n=1 Tax=Chitinophaga oryzae TaxID=2725414 RepID=A0AAE7D6K3_9BACT|nr:MFS transporter [Chitinophaga oryzae]QJB30136.1 MFS transporter [Chitinophaga oryzae]QJB36634.1 MFS transporter [Chitinophaga oryzae]
MQKLSVAGTTTLLLTSCLTIMVGTAIAPSLHLIAPQLHMGAMGSWLITLPSLGVVVFSPFTGVFIDRRGAYTVMQAGLAGYGLLGIAAIFPLPPLLILCIRFLLGGATAAIMSAGTALLAIHFQGTARLKMMALQGMAIELGGAFFLVAGGMLGDIDWRLPFCIYLLAWVLWLLLAGCVPKRPQPGITADSGSLPATTELYPVVAGAAAAMLLFFTCILELPGLLHQRVQFSATQTGCYMGAISLLAVMAAGCLTVTVKRISERLTLATGFALLAAGNLLLNSAGQPAPLLLAAVCLGGGFGFTIPLLNHMTVSMSTAANRGASLGYYAMAVFGGQFLAVFIVMLPHLFLFTGIGGLIISLMIILSTKIKHS